MTGNILGYDLNEKNCQISFYSEEQQEPQTMEIVADNYQIPLVLGRKGDVWSFGNDAKRLGVSREGYTVSNLFVKSLLREKVSLGEETYEAVWLLAKFIELSLEKFEQIQQLVFTVPRMSVDIGKILKGIGQRIGVAKSNIYVQDYKESFCNYMLYQPKELWHYEAALFHCDRYEVRAYMLRKLRTCIGKGADTFVTVDEVASAHIKELAAVYPVLNADKAKDADMRFCRFIEGVFDKRIVSSVFLTGEGFENNWYPTSLRVLCNGRRAFIGNNLYSKGACYTAYRKMFMHIEDPVYLSEDKLTDQISVNMRVNGQEMWYPIVSWGSHWYESNNQWEVLLEDTEDIELHIESLVQGTLKTEVIPLGRLPKRGEYSMRLQIETLFLDEKTCKITVRDVGFGEFFPPTDFQEEKIIHLGGNDGKFNSMS